MVDAQEYLDNTMMTSGHIRSAVIFAIDDQSIVAKSPGFEISGQEMSRILAGYDPKDIDDDPYHTGTTVNGEKYHTLSAQGRLRIGRKGAEGVVLSKSEKNVLLVLCDGTQQVADAANVVEKATDALSGEAY